MYEKTSINNFQYNWVVSIAYFIIFHIWKYSIQVYYYSFNIDTNMLDNRLLTFQ